VEKRWREFLARIDSPAHYDAPEYFLEPYWAGKRPFAVLALDRGRVSGVLTGLHVAGEVTSGLASRPQVRVDDSTDLTTASNGLIEGLLQEAGSGKLITVFTWSWLPLPEFGRRGFHRRELEGDVVLDLSIGAEALFTQFHKNRRRDVRLAMRNGVEVSQVTTLEDLAEYWSVYSVWRQTKRKKIVHDHSFATIERVHALPGNHRRFLARYKGKVIAASGLRFLPGGLVEYANNCSLDEFMHLCPNDLLTWRMVQWACEQGFKKYCLGGAHPFLRKSGGTVVPVWRYRLDRTFLRRHDLRENGFAMARSLLDKAPAGLGKKLRRLLGKR
jgi:hypothetical protein